MKHQKTRTSNYKNIRLQQMFKVPASGLNACPSLARHSPTASSMIVCCMSVNEASPQLVDVSNALLVHPLLQRSPDSVNYGVEVRAVGRPQVGCYEVWRLTTKQLYCIAYKVRWCTVLLEPAAGSSGNNLKFSIFSTFQEILYLTFWQHNS